MLPMASRKVEVARGGRQHRRKRGDPRLTKRARRLLQVEARPLARHARAHVALRQEGARGDGAG